MRKITIYILLISIALLATGCQSDADAQIATTTATVQSFTAYMCQETDIVVTQLITENVSCLHDYTLQTKQMRMIENVDAIIISGAGLETFLDKAITNASTVIDSSIGVSLITCHLEHETDHGDHSHENDPHIWLSPANAQLMAKNICAGLIALYPQHQLTFDRNLQKLIDDLSALEQYGKAQLSNLTQKEIITFHDGFSYMADAFGLTILHAIEEESGSEASAAELIEIAQLVNDNNMHCIFTERNGRTSAAQIISSETDATIYELDMAMSEHDYFSAMYHNIDTLREALE